MLLLRLGWIMDCLTLFLSTLFYFCPGQSLFNFFEMIEHENPPIAFPLKGANLKHRVLASFWTTLVSFKLSLSPLSIQHVLKSFRSCSTKTFSRNDLSDTCNCLVNAGGLDMGVASRPMKTCYHPWCKRTSQKCLHFNFVPLL